MMPEWLTQPVELYQALALAFACLGVGVVLGETYGAAVLKWERKR